MRDGKPQAQPPSEHSGNKRKIHPPMKQSQHIRFTKKRKSVSETLAPSPPASQPPPRRKYSNHCPWSSETHRYFNKNHRSRASNTEGCREWVCSPRDHSGYRDKVVLVSYNLLGVENALKHPDLYYNVPPKYLEWDHRKKLLCKEISQYKAGILCFQEVDRFSDLDSCLHKDGFKGVYQARTGDACDGCAMFWKNEIFSLLHQENIVYQQFGLRDNVAQLCVFEMNQDQSSSCKDIERALPSRRLVVGNIHVLFNPRRGDIKLGQIRLFVKKAYELSQKWGSIPVVLAGDFNSMPQSAIYQFLTSSELNLELHNRRQMAEQRSVFDYQEFRAPINYGTGVWSPVSRSLTYGWSQEELMLATGDGGVTHLKHALELSSAYPEVRGSFRTRDNCGEPLATSYHSSFMGTCDYIWHTPELVPVRVLDTLPLYILRKTGGLPSKNWGSDHLALVCELAFVDDDEKSCCTSQTSSSQRGRNSAKLAFENCSSSDD